MLKRLLPAVLALNLLLLPLQAAAVDYTDIWYKQSESGWGVNMVQAEGLTNTVIFATFFVYGTTIVDGTANAPTWYTAVLYEDVNGNFAGGLYATTGTYYGSPWVPGNVVNTQVGTASFAPSSPYQGTLTYTFSPSGPTVVKAIQRQVLVTILLSGNYVGAQAGAYSGSGCGLKGAYTDTYDLTVTQPGDGTVSFAFNYKSGISCTLSGTLIQFGQLYQIPGATYTCSDGTNTHANVDQLKATALGIEASYAASAGAQGSNSCSEAATFGGPLL